MLTGLTAHSSDVNLSSLIRRALIHNPEIIAAKHRSAASRERIPQAGAWEDPNLFFMFSDVPVEDPSFAKTPMSGTEIGVMQKVPVSGSKGTEKKLSSYKSESMENEYKDTVARIIYAIRNSYYELAYVIDTINITARNKKVSDGLIDIAKARLAAKKDVPEQEVFLAEVDYVNYVKMEQDLNQRKDSLLAELRMMVGDDEPIPAPESAHFKTGSLKYSKGETKEYALKSHPMVLKRISDIRAAEKGVTLAKQSWIPDVDITFSYRFRDKIPGSAEPVNGVDFFSVGANIPIPIFGSRKQGRRVLESKEMLRESENIFEATKREMIYGVEDTWAEYERATNDISLISNSLLPNSNSALDASISAYEAGQADFLNVLSSQIAVYRYEIELAKNRSDRLRALARIDYLTGDLGNEGGAIEMEGGFPR